MNLYELVARMQDEGTLSELLNDPLMMFGQQGQLLGATLLPERLVPSNSYEEASIKFRSVVANSGERHSPAQIRKGPRMTGRFTVSTGSSDIAAVFDSQDHDAIVDLLERQQDFEAAGFISRWVQAYVTEPLRVLVEKERWQAIIDAQVIRTGDNDYYREVDYPDPAGHRFAVGDSWLDDTHDPFDDLFAGADQLLNKGYRVNRIITRSSTMRTMSRHPLVKNRLGSVVVVNGAEYQGFAATQSQINGYMGAEGLPAIETYDEQYFTEENSYHYIPEGAIVMIATTDLDQTITGPEEVGDVYLPNTLGYVAVGRPSGETNPGRAQVIEVSDRKPRTITAEAWQETLPVITRPEAIVVITGALEE